MGGAPGSGSRVAPGPRMRVAPGAGSFLAGLPAGALAALALGPPAPVALLGGALAGGLLLRVAVGRIGGRHGARDGRLARAASAGWLALPALASTPLQLCPGPLGWLLVVVLLLGLRLLRAAWQPEPPPAPRWLPGLAVAWLAAGTLLVIAFGVIGAALAGSGPQARAGRAEWVYDVDARVATRPLPVCTGAAGAAPRVRVLLDRGAHPRLDPAGEALWFDARRDGGARQVYRRDLASGGVECVTCEEPGNNRRPYPGRFGAVFETDRHADWTDPANTEVYFLRRHGEGSEPARRLTWSPGPDDHPLLAQGEGLLVWTRRRAGAYQLASAALRSAHGALALGAAAPLVLGGTAWLAAGEWSPDARSLVVLRGNPFAPLSARGVDFGEASSRALAEAVVPGGAAFDADGSLLAVAESRRGRPAAWLPAALAAPLAPLATRLESGAALYRTTRLRVGESAGALEPLPLPALETWGAPTGLAMSADGVTLYLGQRSPDGERERLVEIRRDCG